MKQFFLSTLLLFTGAAWAGTSEDAEFTAAMNRGDYATMLRIIRPEATQGDGDAQSNLGAMYEGGKGVAQDFIEAVRWYRLSAEQGKGVGQYNLGRMYIQGYGVPQDFVIAHMWLNLSAALGWPGAWEAKKERDRITPHMTRLQIAEAQKMARDCQARRFKRCN